MLRKIMVILMAALATSVYAENANDSDQYNDPTVSSLAASSQQFPGENKLSGAKGQKYNTSGEKASNKPMVNSMMYSGSQFPAQNTVNGTKGQKYHKADAAKKNNPTVNSRLASSQQFPDQDAFNNGGKSPARTTASTAK